MGQSLGPEAEIYLIGQAIVRILGYHAYIRWTYIRWDGWVDGWVGELIVEGGAEVGWAGLGWVGVGSVGGEVIC